MKYFKQYPYLTDLYNLSEILVYPGISTELLPSELYNKQDLILRMNQTPYIDSSPNNLYANSNIGTVTIAENAVTGVNMAVFNGSSSLIIPDSSILFPGSISALLCHVEYVEDIDSGSSGCVLHFSFNGVKFRFLISGGKLYYQVFFSDATNDYLNPAVSKGVLNKATILIINNPGDVTFHGWLNGAYLGSKVKTGKSGSTTTAFNTIGSEPNNITYFKGSIMNISVCGETCTTDEALEINTNSPLKYDLSTYFRFNTDITDPQMLAFGDFDADYDGNILWRVSTDQNTTELQHDGVSWTSDGAGYNTTSEISANIASLPATTQTIRFIAQMLSDGWTQVKLRSIQLGYAINSAPVVSQGTSIIAVVGSIITPGAGFSYSDPDGNASQIYRKWSEDPRVAVVQGEFGSQLEALQAWQLDTTGMTPGNYTFTVFVEDSLGLEDSASIQVCIQSATLDNVYALLQTVSANLDLVKTETDKISAVKTQTDTLPDIKLETDKISLVKLETDKIPTVKTETDKIALIQIETDKIPAIKTQTDTISAIKLETDKIASIKTETDKVPDIIIDIADLQTSVSDLGTALVDVPATVTAIAIQTDKITGIESNVQDTKDRFFGTCEVDIAGNFYTFKRPNGTVLLEYYTFNKLGGASLDAVYQTVLKV